MPPFKASQSVAYFAIARAELSLINPDTKRTSLQNIRTPLEGGQRYNENSCGTEKIYWRGPQSAARAAGRLI
ncbi:hypothetical protein EVAR_93420_1 [Eumeta japonica]|uniref:Uncharacterized protein n=1 Tax=Eumeta variegata TaxID=151549 RepID=A0A4C1UPT0_EUMVA|nr:hypothetical protein EVAR_93420_1 [Eumeta japonica]